MDYVVTLAVTITQLEDTGAQKTVLRTVSTVHPRGLAAAKEAYDHFTTAIKGCPYTEEDRTETRKQHEGES